MDQEPEEFSLEYFLQNNEDIFEYVKEKENVKDIGILFEIQISKKGNPNEVEKSLKADGFKVNLRQSKFLFFKFGFYIDAEKKLNSADLDEIQKSTEVIYKLAEKNDGLLIDCLLSYQ